jgi:hypothetical protein
LSPSAVHAQSFVPSRPTRASQLRLVLDLKNGSVGDLG